MYPIIYWMLLNYINVINVLIDIEYVGMTSTEICWTMKQEGSLSHKPLLFFPQTDVWTFLARDQKVNIIYKNNELTQYQLPLGEPVYNDCASRSGLLKRIIIFLWHNVNLFRNSVITTIYTYCLWEVPEGNSLVLAEDGGPILNMTSIITLRSRHLGKDCRLKTHLSSLSLVSIM